MIIVRLIGGLGNQLFQYAIGRALSARHRTPLKLDVTGFAGYPLRKYMLDRYSISATIATNEEIDAVRASGTNYASRIRRKLDKLRPYYRRHFIKEASFAFDPNVLRSRRNVYLDGYWQSENYFASVRSDIRRELRLRQKVGEESQRLAEQMASVSSVSVHVRRGDYVADPATLARHGVMGVPYYGRAVEYIRERHPDIRLFVFSDDLAWAQQNLAFGAPTTYVDVGGPDRDVTDLYLMSCCKHHVLANSSFSWWGAWLGAEASAIAIGPARWFQDDTDTKDLFPAGWLRI